MPNRDGITERVFQSPSKYVQGPNALKNAAKHLSHLGRAPLLLCDDIVYEIAGKELTTALEHADYKLTRATFSGEATTTEIARLVASARSASPPADFVLALGGGKTLDTGKAVAAELGVPVAVVPTTASTDAPCSAITVLYTPEGQFAGGLVHARNPALVLVDTGVVARAPPRFLSAGIGDALATHVEARGIRNTPNFGGGLPTEVSGAIGARCEEILFKYGRQAVLANKAGAVTPALEKVVEANTLLSGLGFESGGVAAAHSIHDGLTALDNHALHSKLHGEKVAFGIIGQLILDGAPTSELDRYIGLMHSVDLPVTFADLGVPDISDDDIRIVAKAACAPMAVIWSMDSHISEEIVFHSIKGADAAGRDYLARLQK